MCYVALLLHSAYFIKPRYNVYYCNTHLAFAVNLIEVLRLINLLFLFNLISSQRPWQCRDAPRALLTYRVQ